MLVYHRLTQHPFMVKLWLETGVTLYKPIVYIAQSGRETPNLWGR